MMTLHLMLSVKDWEQLGTEARPIHSDSPSLDISSSFPWATSQVPAIQARTKPNSHFSKATPPTQKKNPPKWELNKYFICSEPSGRPHTEAKRCSWIREANLPEIKHLREGCGNDGPAAPKHHEIMQDDQWDILAWNCVYKITEDRGENWIWSIISKAKHKYMCLIQRHQRTKIKQTHLC